MTGVTMLKQYRYKQRHGGLKTIVQIPGKGFDLSKNHMIKKKKVKSKKQLQSELQNPIVKSKGSKVKNRMYTINKKEVIHKVRGYVNQMKGEKLLYFWTVTFPVNTTDDTAHTLLNKWLTRLRSEKMIKEYLWISERQQNKTLHFHMVINRRMDVKKANKFMRASIMHCINNSEIQYSRIQAKNYNGVDIAKDRKTKRVTNFAKQNKQKALSNYLTKYITKNNEGFKHLAWHNSREYSNIITSVRFTKREMSVSKCGELMNSEKKIETEFFIFHSWKNGTPSDILKYLGMINQHLQSKFSIP